jgi:hypothetical protein
MKRGQRSIPWFSNSVGTLQAEADATLHALLQQTCSNYAGYYIVKVLDGKITLLDFALVGEEQSYESFRNWLDGEEEDVSSDDMVLKLAPRLAKNPRGCFIVRGDVLDDDYFSPTHDSFAKRIHEGIENVTDIIAGFYPTGLKSRPMHNRRGDLFVGMCLYRVSDKRYGKRELKLAQTFLEDHESLFRHGMLGWHWRWPERVPRSWWLAWLHLAMDSKYERPKSEGLKPVKKTLANFVSKLSGAYGFMSPAEAVQAFYWRPIPTETTTMTEATPGLQRKN